MKRKSAFTLLFGGLFSLSLLAGETEKPGNPVTFEMPENVKAIVDHSCYGCHNSESKNDKAKEKLLFDKMDDLSKLQKIGAFKNIGEALEKNEMPPSKFLERFPDHALSDEQKKVLLDWAKKESEALVKGM